VRTVDVAMIVAGGAGTRLAPLTASVPKPMVPFCGAPLLEGVVRRMAGAGVRRVLLIVGADPAPFAALGPALARHGVTVEVVPEPEPLDTAGGVRSALDRVEGTFLVLNGDILTDVDPRGLVEAHRRTDAAATLALVEVDDTSTFGVCVLDGTRIVGFVEKPPAGTLPGQRSVNAGTYVLEPEAVARFPAGRLSFERAVFPGLLDAGAHLEGVVGRGVWTDLGTCARLLDGQRTVLDGAMAWPPLDDRPSDASGRRIHPDARIAPGAVLDGPVLVGAGVVIEDGAHVGPHVVLADAVLVGRGVRVVDAAVLAGARLATGAVVEGALVGPGAMVGAAAIVGPGVILAADEVVRAGTQPAPRPAGST
jgi:mannose-1-phosphate guanylyltransferase